MGCNKLERWKSGTHIPKGWRVRGERPYVQVGHDGDRPPWPARDRLCAQGNWLGEKYWGLAELLETECTNKTGEAPWHRHIHLIGGIAQQAAKYPPQLVRAVLKYLKKELEARGELNSVDAYSAGPVPEIPTVDPDWEEQCIDDVNGGILPAEEVRKARALEMDYLHKQQVYRVVPISECYETTGKAPVKVRWIDTNKGDPTNPNFRSRLVAKDIKAAKKPEDQLPANLLFSSTPPLEAMRLLCSLYATQKRSKHGELLKMGLWDISRAHFYGVPKRKIFIELPSEEPASEGGQNCGLLERSMYGAQDAPNIWQSHYSQILVDAGYQRGKSNSSVFYHPEHDVRIMVHGDDFLALGDQKHLLELENVGEAPEKSPWVEMSRNHWRWSRRQERAPLSE